jgi:L-fuculose-phosphate aldolase
MNQEIIHEIIKVAKRMDEKNMVNAFEGNISVKKDGLIYITPTHMNKAFLEEFMIAVIDQDGKQIGGTMKPSSELIMHTLAYKTRLDIGSVVHCHAPFLTAHAICHKEVSSNAYPEMMGNFKVIKVAPFGRPHGESIIKNALPFLEKSDIILLGNHGVLALGKTVMAAMNKVEAAESIARILFLAEKLGTPVDLSKEECDYFYTRPKRVE